MTDPATIFANSSTHAVLTHCRSCGSQRLRSAGGRGDYSLSNCLDCDLTFVADVLPPGFLEQYYQGSTYHVPLDDYHTIEEGVLAVLQLAQAAGLPGNRVLDIGCGFGGFLRLATAAGLQATGIDTDKRRVRTGQKSGLDIVEGYFPEVDLQDRQFDLVWSSHVIEHVENPNDSIAGMSQILAPGGMVVLLTPNFGCPAARICGAHHGTVIPPEHLTYWTPTSMDALMRRHSFERVALFSRGGDWQLKDILQYVLTGAFLRRPRILPYPESAGPDPEAGNAVVSVRPAGAKAAMLAALNTVSAPMMEWFGGDELVAIYRLS